MTLDEPIKRLEGEIAQLKDTAATLRREEQRLNKRVDQAYEAGRESWDKLAKIREYAIGLQQDTLVGMHESVANAAHAEQLLELLGDAPPVKAELDLAGLTAKDFRTSVNLDPASLEVGGTPIPPREFLEANRILPAFEIQVDYKANLEERAREIPARDVPSPDAQVSPTFQGMHTHRYQDNPAELAAARLWELENTSGQSLSREPGKLAASWHEEHSLLGYLLSRDNRGIHPSTRNWLVASTVIQWLGSPVGQTFVAKLKSGDYE